MAGRRLKRPRDPIESAKLIGDIATKQVADEVEGANPRFTERGRRGGKKGGKARAIALPPERRSEIARFAAQARWKKS